MARRGRGTYRQAGNLVEVTIGSEAPVVAVLRGLTPELKRDAIERVLFVATLPLQEAASQAAPRGTGPEKKKRRRKGGQLVESSYGRLFENVSRAIQKRAGQPTVRVGVGDAFWGRFIEQGWNLTKRRPGSSATRVIKQIPARKWFGPAIERSIPEFTRAFGPVLKFVLIAAARRISQQVGIKNATRIR